MRMVLCVGALSACCFRSYSGAQHAPVTIYGPQNRQCALLPVCCCAFAQVLDLSSNEFSAEGVGVIADATRNAAGLRQLRLLGNKIPFGLDTLRQLMQVRSTLS